MIKLVKLNQLRKIIINFNKNCMQVKRHLKKPTDLKVEHLSNNF